VRIFYVSNSILPSRAANSVHVMKMAQALTAAGHTVTLLAPRRDWKAEKGVGDVYRFYGVAPTFQIKKLAFPRLLKGRSLVYTGAAALYCLRRQPDLVIGRHVPACALAATAGFDTVLECHLPMQEANWVKRVFFRLFLNASGFRRLVLISEALKRRYEANGRVPASRIHVAHDAADAPGDVQPATLPGRPSAMHAGYTGSLYAGKGAGLVVEVARRLPGIDFHVVGGREENLEDGPGGETRPNVFFHGFVDPGEVPRYIEAFDVCLLPNQRSVKTYGGGGMDIGGFTSPLKMFEYMAQRKPIVASDLPVLREVLADENTALLCPPSDPWGWARALRRLQQDASLRERLGERAGEVFAQKHSWEARAERILNAAA
jgi:glycosyltransferase involved in cell wall biosynthesis